MAKKIVLSLLAICCFSAAYSTVKEVSSNVYGNKIFNRVNYGFDAFLTAGVILTSCFGVNCSGYSDIL